MSAYRVQQGLQITQNNIRLELKENWQQFSLLVLVNIFVGGMVGLEIGFC